MLKSDNVKLALILALAFYVAAIPHLGNPYRLHIDEWVHIAHSNSLLRAGDIFYPDPFSGQGSSGTVGLLELGYHVPLAIFQSISGLSWIDIAGYLPSVFFSVTILSVYVLSRRLKFGWEAAFFASLLPTAVGILGPGFIVPVALGLTLVCLLFFLLFNHRTFFSYLTVCLIVAYLVILHAPSAILSVMAVAPFVILGVRRDIKHSFAVTAALGLPFLLTLPWTLDLLVSEARSLFVQKPMPEYHSFVQLIQAYGYLAGVLCLAGVFALAMKGDRKEHGLILGLAVLAAMLAIFSSLHYGVGILYLRGLLFTMLLVGIVAGAGFTTLRKLDTLLPAEGWLVKLKSRNTFVAQAPGAVLSLIVIGATLGIAIPDRQAAPYYDMIDKTDYEAFVWIRDNLGANSQKAILDPWKATAFTAVTENYVHTRIHMSPYGRDEDVYLFLENGSKDTAFLRKNGISVLYTRVYDYREGRVFEYAVDNPDLLEANKNTYVLKDTRGPE